MKKRLNRNRGGTTAQFLLTFLITVAIIGGGVYYFLKDELFSKQANIVQEQVPSPPEPDLKPEPKPVVPTPHPEIKSKSEPKAPVKEKPKKVAVVMPDPKPEPAPVKEEKSEIDEMLERTYPFPEFKPLVELVQNWNNVPERAFPEKITVNVALDYQVSVNSGSNTPKTKLEAGHEAKPLKFQPGRLYISSITNPKIKALVSIDDTDFKSQVEKLYERKIDEAKARIVAQREKMREEVAASLAAGQIDSGPLTTPKTRRSASTSAVAKNYGKKFRGDYMPVVRNGKQEEYHDISLGPIGGVAEVPYGKKEAIIRNLWDKGPGARSGLKEGDVIVAIAGKKLKPHQHAMSEGPTGAPEMIGLAMIESQASGKPLELTVKRGEGTEVIAVELPELPAFSETFPADCARSSALVEASGDWLSDSQKEDGFFPSNDYSSAWCGLALLATGNPDYKREITKSARALARKYELGKDPSKGKLIEAVGGLDNWRHCMVGIFLAEYYLATGDEKVKKGLETCCRRMEARIDRETGRLGHSSTGLPYNGKALVIINTHAHLMWALAAQIDDKWDWEPWELSYQAVEAAFCKNDAIGYSVASRVPIQAGARTGSMVTALVLADRESSTVRKMANWMKEHYHEFPDAHAMTSIGIIFGITGLKNTDKKGYRKCMDDYRWMFSLVQPANLSHGSYYYGQKHNHGGDQYCKYRLVANYMTLMLLSSHRDDTLWMFGNRQQGWYE